MEDKKIKNKTIIMVVFVLIFSVGLILINNNNEINQDSKKFSVYIKNGNTYVKQVSGAFPTTGYVLNLSESSCTNGSTLSQNPSTKAINVSMSSTDKCNLYFDQEQISVIEELVSGEPTNTTNVITKPAPSGQIVQIH